MGVCSYCTFCYLAAAAMGVRKKSFALLSLCLSVSLSFSNEVRCIFASLPTFF